MCLGVIFVIILFCVVPLTSMAIDYNKFGCTDLKLPYYVRYFYDPYSMPCWPGEYIHQVGCSVIVCVNIFGADALLYAFCLYLRMHFEILSIDFERLTDSKEDLRELVLRHQELIELVNEVQKIYSTSMLFNIIISSFTICFCGFNITVIKDVGTSFAFLNFLLMSLYQIFMLCFFGDIISVSSTRIGDAIYKSKWYEAKPAFKRSLFIIIMRSRKPCVLSAAKFATLNLTAFTKILSRSWSYFALLRTMYR
ncbi:putative odorant receptor 92a isoform X1 [Pieris rapae]|uniref:putative odorant receptor 92a isoform X1 n=1 Tax=Pieris rapae TaxID=64459 RepID=UPI001E27D8C9|nr:putative odorant receptor 92a isoform X1 [Pieris rapae]